jgi:hypothetical protein
VNSNKGSPGAHRSKLANHTFPHHKHYLLQAVNNDKLAREGGATNNLEK